MCLRGLLCAHIRERCTQSTSQSTKKPKNRQFWPKISLKVVYATNFRHFLRPHTRIFWPASRYFRPKLSCKSRSPSGFPSGTCVHPCIYFFFFFRDVMHTPIGGMHTGAPKGHRLRSVYFSFDRTVDLRSPGFLATKHNPFGVVYACPFGACITFRLNARTRVYAGECILGHFTPEIGLKMRLGFGQNCATPQKCASFSSTAPFGAVKPSV